MLDKYRLASHTLATHVSHDTGNGSSPGEEIWNVGLEREQFVIYLVVVLGPESEVNRLMNFYVSRIHICKYAYSILCRHQWLMLNLLSSPWVSQRCWPCAAGPTEKLPKNWRRLQHDCGTQRIWRQNWYESMHWGLMSNLLAIEFAGNWIKKLSWMSGIWAMDAARQENCEFCR